MRTPNILIVDDDKDILASLRGLLEENGYRVETAADAEAALTVLSGKPISLVLLDVVMPEIDGIEALERIKVLKPDVPVIMISGAGTIDIAVKAIKLGALDFLEKPFEPVERLLISVSNALKMHKLQQENVFLSREIQKKKHMIGESLAVKKLRAEIERAAPTNARVLIMGENGTGKELVAAQIHEKSPRSRKPFVKINCAAIPVELIESELFGYEKGAFTGATSSKEGKFELADGGSLLLDEIGDMGLQTQTKLLRALEEGEIERLGSKHPLKVDVRVISSTNKNLPEEIKRGKFREDLYYRISVIPLYVPPLRERKDDIPLLADHFLRLFCEENNRPEIKITTGAIQALMAYHWPGNIRELKNLMERLVIMTNAPEITESSVREVLGQEIEINQDGNLRERVEAYEKSLIVSTLRRFSWNISQAAKALGIDRANLHKKLRHLGIEKEIDSSPSG
ncbi:MAG: sigma-54-dependent transcriptional regulator [bacterium]